MSRLLFYLNVITSVFCCSLGAQEYSISNIPDSLKQNANAIIRQFNTRIIIQDNSSYILKIEKAVTVLNKAGDKFGNVHIIQDKSNEVSIKHASVYNAKGYRIKSDPLLNVKPDVYYSTGQNVVKDLHCYSVVLEDKVYPYTTSFLYEIKVNGTLNMPTWQPIQDKFISMQNANLSVEIKNDIGFNYHAGHSISEAEINHGKKSDTYSWFTGNWTATTNSIALLFYPEIRIALNNFEIHGEKGSLATWKDFGNWLFELNKDGYELPDELKEIVHDSADKYEDPHLKIKALYNFLKKDFRYVSIQLGIGGWKPQTTEFTFEKGYGDCKALSVLMQAMLREIGLPAYYCIVSSGRDNEQEIIFENFVENRFNHVIVCAFIGTEVIWLECTSNSLEAGFLGDFTNNRWALLVDKDASRLVKTKVSEN